MKKLCKSEIVLDEVPELDSGAISPEIVEVRGGSGFLYGLVGEGWSRFNVYNLPPLPQQRCPGDWPFEVADRFSLFGVIR